jgi:hypothetical protein
MVGSKQCLNIRRRAVPEAYPNNFRRVSEKETALAKVRIFGHDGEPVFRRVAPNIFILRRVKAKVPNMEGSGSTSDKETFNQGDRFSSKRSLMRGGKI